MTPKAAKVMEKKPHPPGEHGRAQNFRRKLSDYKRQLVEKQKLRAQYNIHERQLRNYLRCSNLEVGLLFNFGPAPKFRRFVYSNERKRHELDMAPRHFPPIQ